MRFRSPSRRAVCCIRRWRRRSDKSTPMSCRKLSRSRSPMDLPLISTGSKLKRIVDALAVAVVLAAMVAAARATGLDLSGAEPKLLPPEQAFRFSARALDSKTQIGRASCRERGWDWVGEGG